MGATELSAIVLTKNEQAVIGGCIESLLWAGEIIIIDSFSSDKTIDIARSCGVRVHQHPFNNFAEQRNFALNIANREWVLFLDADEQVSSQLVTEINDAVGITGISGWWIPRKNFIFGRWMRHAGMYPDYQLRLMRRTKSTYNPNQLVHEQPTIAGECGYLKSPILHFPYPNLAEINQSQKFFARLKAHMLFDKGLKPSYHLFFAPAHLFFRRYIILKGYKDGITGLSWCLILGHYHFLTYIYLAQLWLGKPL